MRRALGLIDGKLVESIVALSEDDYTDLIADAGQMDNTYLGTALDALRNANDLLASVSRKAEEEE